MKRISQKDFFTSAGLCLLSTLCLALSASFWKYLTTLGPLQTIVFIRFFFPWLFISLWYFFKHQKIKISSIRPYILRAIIVLIGQYSLLYVLSQEDLLLATLLYSTSGLFSPILLYVFFKVRASNKAIISIFIGFIGVAVALGTWQNIFSPISLIGLLSGLMTAASQLIQHKTSKSDNVMTMNFVLFGLCSLFSLPLLFLNSENWQMSLQFFDQFSLAILGVILAFSFFSIANQTLKNAAFKYVNKATTLLPFFYAVIIFSGIIDWIWLGVVPQLHTIIGVAIIIAGAGVISMRKVRF